MRIRSSFCTTVFLLSFIASTHAIAQNATEVFLNEPAGMETEQAPLRLTPDRSELVHLSEPAKSIIVGNPMHLSVSLDSSNLLILAPGVPGATYFTVLGENGKVIMQRHVIVAAPKTDYIRVRKNCPAELKGCTPTSVYYCPQGDMCSVIGMPVQADATSASDPSDVLSNMADILAATAKGTDASQSQSQNVGEE